MTSPPAAAHSNLRSPAALLRYFGIMVVALAIDLWTKALAVTHLAPPVRGLAPREIEFLPGWLHFTYVENHGAVFGLGQGMRWLFLAVSVGAIVLLTWLFKSSGRARGYQVVLGMLLAGVLGNMYDRAAYGYVRDMIHAVPRWPNLFPWVFNVADSLLCVGVALSILYSLFGAQQAPERSADASAPQSTAR